MSVLLQGEEEAVSNVIKDLRGWLSLVMSCVFEFGIWIRFLARHKVIKTQWKLEKRVLCGFGDKEYFKKCLIVFPTNKKSHKMWSLKEKNLTWLHNPWLNSLPTPMLFVSLSAHHCLNKYRGEEGIYCTLNEKQKEANWLQQKWIQFLANLVFKCELWMFPITDFTLQLGL